MESFAENDSFMEVSRMNPKRFHFTFSAGKTAYWLFALLYWEFLLHVAVFEAFSIKIAYIVGFSGAIALLVAAVFPVVLVIGLILLGRNVKKKA